MKLLAIAAVLAVGAGAQTPELARVMGVEPALAPTDIAGIMALVGRNQEHASELRKEFTFHQKQLLRMNRGGGKVAREEKREYDVAPGRHNIAKELVHFEGRYDYKGKYVAYDRP